MSDTATPAAPSASAQGTPTPSAPSEGGSAPVSTPQTPATPAEPQGGQQTPTAPATPQSFLSGQQGSQGGQAPAEAPANFFGDHVQEGGQFKEGWTEGLQKAGFERLANKAALAKDEGTLLKSLDDALGLVGKKASGVSYPKAGATEEQIQSFRQDAGVPESVEGYELKPQELPQGVEWSDEFGGEVAGILHKHHIPKEAAQELVSAHLKQVQQQGANQQQLFGQKMEEAFQQTEQTFRKEWGSNYEQRLEANQDFVSSRFDSQELQNPMIQAALTHPTVVRIVDEARRALREAPLPGSGQEAAGQGSHSPRQQAVEIMTQNPGWRSNPELSRRVSDLYKLDAARNKRSGK